MIKADAFIRHGRLEIGNRKLFLQEIQDTHDQPVQIVIKSLDKRSNRQNRYWWGAVVASIAHNFKDRGYKCTNEDVHELLKQKFNAKSVILFGERKIPQSTTKLSRKDFAEMVDRVRDWADETLELWIDSPSEYYAKMGIDYDTGEIIKGA